MDWFASRPDDVKVRIHQRAMQHIDRLEAAIRTQRDAKGRYNTEVASKALWALIDKPEVIQSEGTLP